jgi:hypothetical protein
MKVPRCRNTSAFKNRQGPFAQRASPAVTRSATDVVVCFGAVGLTVEHNNLRDE